MENLQKRSYPWKLDLSWNLGIPVYVYLISSSNKNKCIPSEAPSNPESKHPAFRRDGMGWETISSILWSSFIKGLIIGSEICKGFFQDGSKFYFVIVLLKVEVMHFVGTEFNIANVKGGFIQSVLHKGCFMSVYFTFYVSMYVYLYLWTWNKHFALDIKVMTGTDWISFRVSVLNF